MEGDTADARDHGPWVDVHGHPGLFFLTGLDDDHRGRSCSVRRAILV